MDTTQKNREAHRRPRPQEGEERRSPKQRPAGERPAEERRAKRPPEARNTTLERPHSGKSAPRPKTDEKRRPPVKKQGRPQPQRKKREDDDTLGSKPRSYGKTKPKKKSGFSAMGSAFKQSMQRSSAKAKARKAAKGHGHSQQPTPAVIYTEPKAFNRRRFTMQLVTMAAMVLALMLGLSVFFKVENITVSGADVYSAWAVREASGIQEGDNLLSFGNVRAGAMIKKHLPYVDRVRIGIKLPDTVNIIIEEEDVVYAIKSQDGLWWLMTSDGRMVEQSNGGQAASYTQILGVTLDNPVQNEKAIAAEMIPAGTQPKPDGGAEGEAPTTPPAVTGAQRLNAALKIVKALEANGIVGEAASVDVSQMEKIILWYGSRYQVNLGDDSRLEEKIAYMNDAILQLSDYQSGNLDISFTIWPDKVAYTPFGQGGV